MICSKYMDDILVASDCYKKIPLSGLNNRHLFLTHLESGKSKIRVPVLF